MTALGHASRRSPPRARRWRLLVVVAGLLAGCQAGSGGDPPASTAPAGDHQPAPIRFSGQEATTTTEPFLLAGGLTVFTGEHRGRGSFRVEILDEQGRPQRLLFLSTGRYRGSTGLSLRGGIYRLAVAARTPWQVEITQPRGRDGAALPRQYQGVGDALVGPFRADREVRVEVEQEGPGDLTLELLSDQGESLYFLVEESGPVRASRTAAGLEAGDYYLNVEADQAWKLALRPG